jgi:peptide/nickel transport system substrate-binding protein
VSQDMNVEQVSSIRKIVLGIRRYAVKRPILILPICLILVAIMLTSMVACGTPEPAPAQPTTPATPATPAAPATPAKPPATTEPTPKYGGILRYAGAIMPTSTFGWPAKMMEQDSEVIMPILETLIREDDQLKIHPFLATSWKVADDKSSITLTLRNDVLFHDGTKFDANAVKFNLDAVKDGKLPGTSFWTTIDVVDNYTVRINLSKWENSIIPALASRTGMMISPAAVQKNGVEWAGQNPVGTGPFKFTKFERDVSFECTKNENYWQKGKPYLNGIKYVFIPQAETMIAAFKAGELDEVAAFSSKTLSDLVAGGDELVFKPDGAFILYPDIANADSPWSNKLVREAASYALDREALAKALGFGVFTAGYQWPRPGATGYIEGLARKYDPEKAKQLLKDAGYPDGFKSFITSGSNTTNSVAVQGQLAKVGIQLDLDILEGTKYSDYITKGWHNRVMCSPAASYQNFLVSVGQYYTTPNYYVSLKGPPGWETLYKDALSTVEVEPAKVQALTRAMFDDVSVIPWMYMGLGHVYHKDNFLNDNGHFTQSYHKAWTPENAWFSNPK